MAVFIKYNESFMIYEKAVQYSFHIPIFVNVRIIVLTCSIFAEEFEYQRIIPIKTKYPNASMLVLIKLLVIFMIHVILMFICSSFNVICSLFILKYNPHINMFLRAYYYNFAVILPMFAVIIFLAIIIIITKKEKNGLNIGEFIYLLYGIGTGLNFLIIKKTYSI